MIQTQHQFYTFFKRLEMKVCVKFTLNLRKFVGKNDNNQILRQTSSSIYEAMLPNFAANMQLERRFVVPRDHEANAYFTRIHRTRGVNVMNIFPTPLNSAYRQPLYKRLVFCEQSRRGIES